MSPDPRDELAALVRPTPETEAFTAALRRISLLTRAELDTGLPPLPDHIAYSLTAYRAIHGGTLPDLREERERRTLYITQGRARSRP